MLYRQILIPADTRPTVARVSAWVYGYQNTAAGWRDAVIFAKKFPLYQMASAISR
jgi:hypothetical protein